MLALKGKHSEAYFKSISVLVHLSEYFLVGKGERDGTFGKTER